MRDHVLIVGCGMMGSGIGAENFGYGSLTGGKNRL